MFDFDSKIIKLLSEIHFPSKLIKFVLGRIPRSEIEISKMKKKTFISTEVESFKISPIKNFCN